MMKFRRIALLQNMGLWGAMEIVAKFYFQIYAFAKI